MRSAVARTVVAILAGLLCAGCAAMALSTGDTLDRAAVQTAAQLGTLEVTASAGLHDPAPTVTLGVVLDDIEETLEQAAGSAAGAGGDAERRDALLGLIEETRRAATELRAALDAGDGEALRRAAETTAGIAAGLDDWRAR